MKGGTIIGIQVGQIWQVRKARRDGSHERVQVLDVNGQRARVRSLNPLPGQDEERVVAILLSLWGGSPGLGNMKLVANADGAPLRFRPDGVVELGRVADGSA